MKKLAILLTMLMFTPIAMAVFVEGTGTNPDILRKTGHSEATIRLLEDVKVRNSGYGGTPYESYFTDVSYENGYPSKKAFMLDWYKKIRNSIDPGQDDGYFGKHEIHYDNRYFFMMPSQNIFDKSQENL